MALDGFCMIFAVENIFTRCKQLKKNKSTETSGVLIISIIAHAADNHNQIGMMDKQQFKRNHNDIEKKKTALVPGIQ